ncbi:hypothetical protein EDD16DRAFT_1641098 [Pisolithus croceorrhizus]|nr:hypothetical protein EDD16DRAFT_1641098 [Pisolithus croceorrhizus]
MSVPSEIITTHRVDMQSGALLFDKDFSLHDAMAAFEIGEPRFDSGLALLDDSRPPFDPLAPLLPEQVCWVIDHAVSCETTFFPIRSCLARR